MNSNFEHLVNTPAPERDGMSEALRMVDWARISEALRMVDWARIEELEAEQVQRSTCLAILIDDELASWCRLDFTDEIHRLSDARSVNRYYLRTCRDRVDAIRAIRKELWL